jgi:hypothetical protein
VLIKPNEIKEVNWLYQTWASGRTVWTVADFTTRLKKLVTNIGTLNEEVKTLNPVATRDRGLKEQRACIVVSGANHALSLVVLGRGTSKTSEAKHRRKGRRHMKKSY